MNDYFYRLFDFNNWANNFICNHLSENEIRDEDCIKLMSHLFLAQSNWYYRIINQQNDQPVWQILELAKLPELLNDNGTAWLDYIQGLDKQKFIEQIDYNNLAGQPFSNTIQDTLAHVVNHATYHRGQIVRRIRELGHIPPSTDYIQYARIFPSTT
ncbi:DinB family protein [Dyadobacter subterraneus]|uniref:DinB family protein n=1 Tax=Dyadobacter subterraneus TaxID=2773304 RepID=A0ABR9WB06_9BACT|nr:DinB family protein [Dyadobacter subterraneus]MBE9462657.1 DinB family protein [Dyadobacter subterraneus]